eukprot:TRINITY_DN10357_c0_g2_i1.p1 TRINITY_DN10357_c0_g2~~TRINITY_DN10357_c0_g2_i1.p1  ORF type:complete len:416 (-),score=74.63 TRINITY_DN10357_c0_g2_i1:602-1849(-)
MNLAMQLKFWQAPMGDSLRVATVPSLMMLDASMQTLGRKTRRAASPSSLRSKAACVTLSSTVLAGTWSCLRREQRASRVRRYGRPGSAQVQKILRRPETCIAHAGRKWRPGHNDLQLCRGISELVERYDAFTVDPGVLHNGINAFPEVSSCLEAIKAAGKSIIILSSDAGRASVQLAKLSSIGVNPDQIDGIVTSGDLVYRYLSRMQEKLGTRILWVARTQQQVYGLSDFFDGLPGYSLASSVEDANFFLVSGAQTIFAGTEAEEETGFMEDGQVHHYRQILRIGIHRSMVMLCADPALGVTESDGRKLYSGGSLAKIYEQLGGRVIYFGKPYTAAFEEARNLLCELTGADADELDSNDFRICHIGNSLHDDVAGAAAVGMDAAFIADEQEAGVRQLCRAENVCLPQCVVPHFAW